MAISFNAQLFLTCMEGATSHQILQYDSKAKLVVNAGSAIVPPRSFVSKEALLDWLGHPDIGVPAQISTSDGKVLYVRSASIGGELMLVLQDVTQNQNTISALRLQANTDPLTGLLNRRGFEFQVTKILATSPKEGNVHLLSVIDVDDLKSINTKEGHSGGDRALKAVGHCLSAATRRNDAVARIGGDEFAICLANTPSMDMSAIQIRILNEVRQNARCTVSIGIVSCPTEKTNLADLLDKADILLGRAKRSRGK